MVYPDTQAVFTCEVKSGSIGVWYINSTDIRELSEELKNDIHAEMFTSLTMTLNITARVQYNNTLVQCAAQEIGGSGNERSNVTLTIQGTAVHVRMYNIHITKYT